MNNPLKLMKQGQSSLSEEKGEEKGVLLLQQDRNRNRNRKERRNWNRFLSNKILDSDLQKDNKKQSKIEPQIINQEMKSEGEIELDSSSQKLLSIQSSYNLYQGNLSYIYNQDSNQNQINILPQQVCNQNSDYQNFDNVDLQQTSNKLKQKKDCFKQNHLQNKNLFMKKLNKKQQQAGKDQYSIYLQQMQFINKLKYYKSNPKQSQPHKYSTITPLKVQTNSEEKLKTLEPIFISLPKPQRKKSLEPIIIQQEQKNTNQIQPYIEDNCQEQTSNHLPIPDHPHPITDPISDPIPDPIADPLPITHQSQQNQQQQDDKEIQKQNILKLIKENQKGFLQLLRSGKLFDNQD